MRYKDRPIQSVADLLEGIRDDEKKLRSDLSTKENPLKSIPVWYRGLPEDGWDLETTMARHKALSNEIPLMNRFKQNASQFLDHLPEEPWEWLFLMRHYGLPSRLLDWSESLLVGLFFAVNPVTRTAVDKSRVAESAKVDGVLWCLLPAELNHISGVWTGSPNVIPMFEDPKSDLSVYLPEDVIAPAALESGRKPAAGIAKRGSKRMQAQHGVFTIEHVDQTPLNKIDGQHVWRYIVPGGEAKANVGDELRRLGITALTVFPELDNVAAAAAEALNVDV